jgi:integrase
MATIVRLHSGNWRAQVRRKGRYASRTFRLKEDADTWAFALEREIDLPTKTKSDADKWSFEELIDLYLEDMRQLGHTVGRTRRHLLERIRPSLGRLKLSEFTRPNLIEFGRSRARQSAGPATVLSNFSDIRAILTHVESVHGVRIPHEDFRLASVALRKLGLMRESIPRRRRPTVDEINRLIEHFQSHPRQYIPMDRIIQFAIATAIREGEIFRIEWKDVDKKKRLVTIRDRKAPQDKQGNHQVVPLLNLTGFDAWQIIMEQRILTRGIGRVFPYSAASAGSAFGRACQMLNIEDLRFHDLRRESATRFFEAGLPIEKVALITGHKSWDMLKRYTRLNPEDLVKLQTAPQLSVAEFVEQLMMT